MSNEEINNIALYTRVSTEDQAQEGYSLDAQLDKVRGYCKIKDWNIFHEYIEEGHSGRTIKRPQYQKMFKDIDKWDAVVVIKMDRIHRNSKNFMAMMDLLKKEDKEFVSVMENLDTSTAMGRFVMDIIQRIAQLESEQLGERTFIGMKQKARTNGSGFMGHQVPFGYCIIKTIGDDGTPTSHLESVNEELEIVKKIFELAHQGSSINKISKSLNQPYSRVHYILHNPWYAGWERWLNELKKTDIPFTVHPNIWNIVQNKITKRIARGTVRSNPLQIPTDDKTTYVQLSKEEYFSTSNIRNLGNRKPKHNLGF